MTLWFELSREGLGGCGLRGLAVRVLPVAQPLQGSSQEHRTHSRAV